MAFTAHCYRLVLMCNGNLFVEKKNMYLSSLVYLINIFKLVHSVEMYSLLPAQYCLGKSSGSDVFQVELKNYTTRYTCRISINQLSIVFVSKSLFWIWYIRFVTFWKRMQWHRTLQTVTASLGLSHHGCVIISFCLEKEEILSYGLRYPALSHTPILFFLNHDLSFSSLCWILRWLFVFVVDYL